jgi:predicted phosphodiesterase
VKGRQIREAVRKAAWVLFFLLMSFSGAILSACTLGRSVYRWHGFAVELRLMPDIHGETTLVLVPLGSVRAHTHRAPVALIASLEEIQLDEINKLLKTNPKVDLLTQDFEKSARAALANFVARQLAFAAIGALLAPALLRSRTLWKYLVSLALGVGLVGGTLGSALLTFNGKAFESPTYTGALRQAPWVIQFGKDAFVRIEELSQKLRTVAANLNVLYGRIESPPDRLSSDPEPDTFRVLHVSDLHNNPAGMNFFKEVAQQFRVSLIVDTGDLTDFGSPPETILVQGIGKIGYPYVFVAGNHDSQTVINALSNLPNVTILNGQLATVKGLTFLGLPNPASARASVGNVDTTPEEIQAGGERLLHILDTLPEPPDIVAIHNPEEARPLWGHVPLVLCGHMHRYYVETHNELMPPVPPTQISSTPTPAAAVIKPFYPTVVGNAGTTGAAGLRYFEKEGGVPFSCAVLTFRRPPAQVSPTASSNTPNSPADVPPGNTADNTPGKSDTGAREDKNARPPVVQKQPADAPSRPQLRAIDLIVLDGSLHEYSITHYSIQENVLPTLNPR